MLVERGSVTPDLQTQTKLRELPFTTELNFVIAYMYITLLGLMGIGAIFILFLTLKTDFGWGNF